MTTYEKNESLLKAFGIPPSHEEGVKDEAKVAEQAEKDKVAENVRAILARLLVARSLRLAQLQTARDIYERAGKDDPRLYLFLAAMFLSEGQGNAYMRVEKVQSLLEEGGYLDDPVRVGLVEKDKKYEENPEQVKKEDYTKFLDSVRGLLSNIIWEVMAQPFDNDILIHEKVKDESRWYFQRDKASVKEVSERLKKFADKNKKLIDEKKVIGDVSAELIKKASVFAGFPLNDKQKEALLAASENRFTVITGRPGTGKTTTVCAILRALFAAHPDWTEKDVALAAPTGRAAQRMSEAVLDQCDGLVKNKKETEDIVKKIGNLKGSTIHRLLGGYAPKWQHHEKNKLEQEVVIVDETSMVDIYLMHALIAALKDDARLILLGDADQLPSVDTGAVLGDLTTIGLGAFVQKLEVCERAKGEVSEVAKAINELPLNDGEAAETIVKGWRKIEGEALPCIEQKVEVDGKSNDEEKKDSRFEWLCPKADIKKEDIQSFYSKWMDGNKLAAKADAIAETDDSLAGVKSKKSEDLFKELNRRRILTLVREGWYGVKEANAFLLKAAKAFLLKEAKAAAKVSGDYLSMVGVPIMVTHNTPERNLFNGDVGVTVRGPHGMVVLFPRGAKTIACPVALLPEHELAYAMTVHKSQGSEFENVMVVLPDDENHPLLNRQIVYTGITRAKKRAVVVGTEGALTAALSRKIERDTGVSL